MDTAFSLLMNNVQKIDVKAEDLTPIGCRIRSKRLKINLTTGLDSTVKVPRQDQDWDKESTNRYNSINTNKSTQTAQTSTKTAVTLTHSPNATWSGYHWRHIQNFIFIKIVNNFFSYPANRQRNRETDTETDRQTTNDVIAKTQDDVSSQSHTFRLLNPLMPEFYFQREE